MANRKKHINSEADLFKAMRLTGYCFPINAIEQKISLKLQPLIDIEALAKNIDPSQIWEQEESKPYKYVTSNQPNPEISFEEQWGMAAKGNVNISKEIMDKIKKRQLGQNDNDGNS
jgi:hypothetical protein